MKRHSTYSLLFVSIFLLLASVSCRKEDFNGTAISFMASSRESVTKVGYSDEKYNVGGSNYERVDWKVGDLIRIYSADVYPSAGWADFSVRDKDEKGKGGVEARNEKSIAHVNPVNGNGLLWNGNKPHTFYCVYPAPVTGKVTTAIDGNSIKGSIPAEQTYKENLEEDLLMQVGCTKVESPVPSVDVDFTPVTTCFDFTISNGTDTDMQVTSVTLKRNPGNETDAFSGDFEVSFDGSGAVQCTPSGATGDSVTLTFPEGKRTTLLKQSDATLRFRIFLNPGNDITSPKFIVRTADGNVRSTTLKKKDDVTFKAMHKTNITGIVVKDGIMVTSFGEPQLLSWEDEPEELGIEAEYRYVYDASDLKLSISDVPYDGETYPLGSVVSYRVKYDTKGVEGVEPAFVGDVPDWLACSVTLDNTKTLPTYNVAVTVKQNIGTHTDVLNNAPQKGTADAPFDLSYYNPSTGEGEGKSGSVSRNTANCYVVNAPGYYKFPLVYGNTIKNGAVNTGAYNTDFKNAYEKQIGSYKINADKNKNSTTITIDDYSVIAPYNGVASIVNIVGFETDSEYQYIKFHISKDDIKPSNDLITIKSGNDIVWSWHIWTTDVDLSNSPSSSPKIMPVNLGWISGSDDTCSSDRECAFNFGNAGETATLTVSQKGKPAVDHPSGTSTYYQWGRKDPSLATSKFITPSSNYPIDYAEGIKNPDTFYKAPDNQYNWSGDFKPEYWLISNGKTIYDPCPVGFRVMSSTDASNLFVTSDVVYTGKSGTDSYYAKVKNDLYLPVFGRLFGALTPTDKETGYYWTTNYSTANGSWGGELIISGEKASTNTERIQYAFPIRPRFE